MKRIFLAASLLIAATSFTSNLNANASTVSVLTKSAKGGGKHIPASEVPAPVMASFNEKFPTAANAQWEKGCSPEIWGGLRCAGDLVISGLKIDYF